MIPWSGLCDDENMLDSSKFADISKVSFKTIRENKLNYMIVWKDEVEAKENNFYTRENSLRSEYDGPTHKKSDEALIKKYDEYYANHEENKLFVLQTQRTAKTLLGKPSFYEKRISNKIDQYVLNIANDNSLLEKTNIIMRDFVVSNIEKVNNILSLNLAKNSVKTESLVLFRNRVQK